MASKMLCFTYNALIQLLVYTVISFVIVNILPSSVFWHNLPFQVFVLRTAALFSNVKKRLPFLVKNTCSILQREKASAFSCSILQRGKKSVFGWVNNALHAHLSDIYLNSVFFSFSSGWRCDGGTLHTFSLKTLSYILKSATCDPKPKLTAARPGWSNWLWSLMVNWQLR